MSQTNNLSTDENAARMVARNTLVWEREFDVDPEILWKAIATREGLGHWFMPTKFDIELGGSFSFKHGWSGKIARVESPHLIQFNPKADEDAYLRFEIERISTESLFRLTDKMGPTAAPSKILGDDTPKFQIYQPGGIGTHWSGIVAGYHGFVNALETYITGNKIPFDYDDMAKRYSIVMDEWHSR